MSELKDPRTPAVTECVPDYCVLDYCSNPADSHFGIFCVDHWRMVPCELRVEIIAGNRNEQLAALDTALGHIHCETAEGVK